MSSNTVKVLNIISPGSGTFGGIEAYLLSYYEHMDHCKIHFDFAFCGVNTMTLHMNDEVFRESEFIELKVLKRSGNNYRNWIELIDCIRRLVGEKRYDIVEVHTASPMIQAVCGIALKPIKETLKIAHSHALQEPSLNIFVNIASKMCIRIIRRTYDYFFACSNAAGTMYGDKILHSERFRKVNNAIDCAKFAFNQQVREIIRNQNGVDEKCLIVGHVARLSEEKNQVFLVEVFNEIQKRKSNSKLWIVGEGEARKEIERRACELGVSNSVILFGQRSDVSDLLQAMDVFIITSFLEGLCISAIESQAAGLPTFVSMGVPEECKVIDCFKRIDLALSPSEWADIIVGYVDTIRKDTSIDISSEGYDIQSAALELERFYCEHHIC